MTLPHFKHIPKIGEIIIEPIFESLFKIKFSYGIYTLDKFYEDYINDNCIKYIDTFNYIDLVFNLNQNITNPKETVLYTDIIKALVRLSSIEIKIHDRTGKTISNNTFTNLTLEDYTFKQDLNSNEICYFYVKLSKNRNERF